jgi:hypothetical protein
LGRKVAALHDVVYAAYHHDEDHLSDEEFYTQLNAFLLGDTSQDIRDEIDSVADQAKADIEALRSLVSGSNE